MKKQLIIAVFGALLILFGATLNTAVSSFTGPLSDLPIYVGAPQPYSYILDTNGTHYFAWNGTTGYNALTSTNGSYLFEQALTGITTRGSLFIRAGYYALTTLLNDTTLTDDKSLMLIGEGNNCTVLQLTGTDYSARTFVQNSMVSLGTIRFFQMENLELDANQRAKTVLNWTGASSAKARPAGIFLHNRFRGSQGGYAVRFKESQEEYIEFRGNRISNAYQEGGVAGGLYHSMTDSLISNNYIGQIAAATSGLYADIAIYQGTNIVRGNYFGGSNLVGVLLWSSGNILDGNTIDNHEQYGMVLRGSAKNNTVTNNKITQSSDSASGTYPAIYLYGSSTANSVRWNLFDGNQVYNGPNAADSHHTYAFEEGVYAYNNTFTNNVIGAFVTAPFKLDSFSVARGNFINGYPTEQAGSCTIASGDTGVAVTVFIYNLTIVIAQPSNLSVAQWAITDITSQTFTLNQTGDTGGGVFYYYAQWQP